MQINSRLESIEPEIRTGVLPLSGAVEQVNEQNLQIIFTTVAQSAH